MATGEFVWHGNDIAWWSEHGVFTVDLKANGQRLLNGHATRFTSVAAAKMLDKAPRRFEKEIAGVDARRNIAAAAKGRREVAGRPSIQTLPMPAGSISF